MRNLKTLRTKKLFLIFAFTVLIINLLQASLWPLIGDEAYYWVYSTKLDFGYFDHPPMIAVMIKAGYSLFHNELGVRLLVVLFSFCSFLILWKITKSKLTRENVIFYTLLYISFPFFNLYGFVATPDSPLLLFSMLFFLFLSKIEEKPNIKNAVLLGIISAALMFSKYHGAIFILFLVLFNLKVLKNKYFWLAVLIAIILFSPHILWQIKNDFPTLQYHLEDRNTGFSWFNFIEFIYNSILVLNPFVVILYTIALIKTKGEKFSKNDYFFFSIILFFFVFSFKGHAEPHWIAISSIPLFISLFEKVKNGTINKLIFKVLTITSIALILSLRILILLDFPEKIKNNNRQIYTELATFCGKTPVVFMNSYQKAALYSFYSGNTAISENNACSRKNQYDIWHLDQEFYNQKVYYFYNYELKDGLSFTNYDNDTLYYRIFEHFIPTQKITIKIDSDFDTLFTSKKNELYLTIKNPYPIDLYLPDNKKFKIFISFFIKNKSSKFIAMWTDIPDTLKKNETYKIKAIFKADQLKPGKYDLKIGISSNVKLPSNNSPIYKTIIIDNK